MNTELSEWINKETARRGWTLRQVARRGGVAHTSVIRVANGEQGAGPRVLIALAKAFDMEVDHVYRIAGILPTYEPAPDEGKLIEMYRELPEDQRGLVMKLVESLTGRTVARIVGAEETEE